MPKLEQGDLEAVERLKRINIPPLAKLAREGYAILAGVPSCTLMFKQELPLDVPRRPRRSSRQGSILGPVRLLHGARERWAYEHRLQDRPRLSLIQAPCHGRVQNIGKKTEEFLKSIPDTHVKTTERCSGHAGTYGVKKEFHETSMKIGRPVFRTMNEQSPDYISSDCPLGGHHIAQGIRENHGNEPSLAHPLSLVARAYGLNEE